MLLRKLDRPKPQTGNVRVIYLDYAKAKPTAEVLTKVVANLSKLGPGGGKGESAQTSATVEADEETNALLITAEGDTLNSLLEVVERLDIRRAQVLIEAIIVELDDGANVDLGVSWMGRNTEKGIYGASEGGGGSIAEAALGGAIDQDDDENKIGALTALATALAQASSPGQVLGLVGTSDDVDFNVVLKALESDSKTNILSTPTLLTLDNTEASFTVGQSVPFVTGSFSNTGTGVNSPFQTIQREDIGITLKVTPQINEGDKVVLEIEQEISSISESAASAADLITNQRKLTTKVLTADGEVIVMGGFIREETKVSERRVPVLGSLPVLGRLFRTDSNDASKSNLMIFIRASVIRDDEALHGATAEKYEYIREQQMQMRDRGFLRAKDKKTPILPDMSVYDLSLPANQPATDEK